MQKEIIALIFLLLLVSGLEVISTASFLPLLKLLQSNDITPFLRLKPFIEYFNISFEHENLLIIISISIIIIFFYKLVLGIFVSRFRNKTIYGFHFSLMNRLFYIFTKMKYKDYLNKSSSSLIQNLFTESNQVRILIDSSILLFMEILVSCFLLTASLYYNFKFTLIVFVFFTIIYIGWKFFSKNNLIDLSKARKYNEKERLKLVQMLFLSFKEILVLDKFSFFLERWNNLNSKVINILIKYAIKQETVKPILEFFTISAISTLVIFITLTNNSTDLFVSLGFFAAISYRLLPSINKVIGLLQIIKFASAALQPVLHELRSSSSNTLISNFGKKNITNLEFNEFIKISNLTFSYDSDSELIFDNLNLEINKGDFIGIIGKSGSGKSTLVDLLLGLLQPNKGYVSIDNVKLIENEIYWWNKISYVSQRLNLLEESILENIVLGDKDYNHDKINKLLVDLELDTYVSNLKDGVNSVVKENSVNISGGQKQRLLLARALYRNPEILILDEATSSLDIKTESSILQLLKEYKNTMTIIFITHKKENLEYCNKIFKVENKNVSIL